jgi:hypothetical protein
MAPVVGEELFMLGGGGPGRGARAGQDVHRVSGLSCSGGIMGGVPGSALMLDAFLV